MLDNVGLIHMNGRVFDPVVARFGSSDPHVPHPSHTQSFNRYSYSMNNPLARVDPSGFGDEKKEEDANDNATLDGGGQSEADGGGSMSRGVVYVPVTVTGSRIPVMVAVSFQGSHETFADNVPRTEADGSYVTGFLELYGGTSQNSDSYLGDYNPQTGDFDSANDPMFGGGFDRFLGDAVTPHLGGFGAKVLLGANSVVEQLPEAAVTAGTTVLGGPAASIALRGIAFGVRALRAAPALPAALNAGKNAESGISVYLGVKNGQSIYSGITSNLQQRAAQHGARFDMLDDITRGATVTRGEARAIEEALIVRNRGTNLRHEISPTHEWYDDAVAWGEGWLRRSGY